MKHHQINDSSNLRMTSYEAFRVIKRLVEDGRYVEAMDVPGAQDAFFDLWQAARKGLFSEHLITAILNRDRVKLLEEENKYRLREVSARLSAEWETVKRKLNAGYVLEVSLKEVWESYPASERIKVLTQVKNLTTCMPEVKNTLDAVGIPEDDLDTFWKTHRPRNTYDPLYPLAPSSLQLDVWLSHDFLSLPVASQADELRSRAKSISKSQWESIFSGARKNRERLQILLEVPIEIRVSCFTSEKMLTDLQNEVTRTLQSQEISNVRSAVMDEFWIRHRPIDQHDFLYLLAPAALRREVWFAKVLPLMPLQSQVNAISKIAPKTLSNEWVALAKRLAVDFSATIGVDYFLALLPAHAKVIYFACLPSIRRCTPLAIAAICQVQVAGDDVSKKAITFFWEKRSPIEPDDPLFQLAPAGIQRGCCRKFYANLLHQLDDLFVFTNEVSCVFPADREYDDLTQKDRDLAAQWGEGRWNAEAQMLSARTAEKVTANFYRKLGQTVRDVSIEQLNRSAGADWQTHDLLIDSSCAIDVKNARYPMNSKSCYLEHTVPKFKKNRSKSDVLIAGVVSPYLRLEFINNPESAYFAIPPIVFLGCTSLPEIDVLCSKFTSNTLEVRNPTERIVPAWLFDYPNIWYRDFDIRCASLRMEMRWPTLQELSLLFSESELRNTVPKLIAAGVELPKTFLELLEPWQREFCTNLKQGDENPRVSLPWLFLTVLSDFLRQLSIEDPAYAPSKYKDLFYANASRWDSDGLSRPLGIADPLGIIHGLCESLELLWVSRRLLRLVRFHSFRFSGPGLLQGRESFHSPWETILAYCGGWIFKEDEQGKWVKSDQGIPQKLGKCGSTPLILGRENLCSTCHKLICQHCGFCSQPCENDGLRESRLPLTKVTASNRTS